jgi:hypothetical protein
MAQIRRDYDKGGSDRSPRRDLRPTAKTRVSANSPPSSWLLDSGSWLLTDLLSPAQLLVAETGNQMIVYHAHGLHKRVASGWAKKLEAICL